MVTVNDSASLGLTTGMTLEAWVRPTALATGWSDIIYKAQDTYFLMGTTPQGQAPDLGGTFASRNVYGPSPLPLNTWSHLAGTYDGATMRFYVNSVLVATRPQSGAIAAVPGLLSIGGDAANGQYWTGLIDEVRIYNRVISQDQIHTDMSKPLGSPTSRPGTNSPARVVSN
jgi:hypothetical protein